MHKRVIQVHRISSPNRHNVRKKVYYSLSYHRKGVWDEVKLLELKEEYDLCDIWRIRNPTKKLYTFRQNHSAGIINRRLDYIFI